MCQHSGTCTVHCYLKVKHATQNGGYVNELLYMLSPLLTASKSTSVTDNSTNTYGKDWYSRLMLHLGARPLMVGSFTLRLFYPPVPIEQKAASITQTPEPLTKMRNLLVMSRNKPLASS